MLFTKKEKYNLNDIQRLFSQIPVWFILFLAILLCIITTLILDSKKTRVIDLLKQKYTLNYNFEKKEELSKFKTFVKKSLNDGFLEEEELLKKVNHQAIGFISSNKLQDMKKLKEYFFSIEKDKKVKLVLYKKDSLDILYGTSSIRYLENLIFNSHEQKFRDLTLKYIYSQGRENLQYWEDDVDRTVRLTYFDKVLIDNEVYLVGAFSTINSINDTVKKVIVNTIKKNNFDVWFYDVISNITFNFNNKKEFNQAKELLRGDLDKNSYDYKVLDYYIKEFDFNKQYENVTYYYDKFNFLIVAFYDKNIIENRIKDKVNIIKSEYNNTLMQIFVYILVITALLILLTYLFTNYIKTIFNEYNEELETKKVSLEHWKKRFELAIIASNDGLWDIDFKTNKIYFSEKWLDMFGYKEEELTTFNDWFELIHKEEKIKVENLFSQIFSRESDTFICEYRLKTKNDGFKWVLARGKAFLDENGELDRMLMMSMDIDKNKRMKKELLDVELLVEDGKIVIFKLVNDTKLSVKYISNSIKNFGFIKKDLESGRVNFMDLIHPDDINKVQVAINAALKNDLESFTFISRVINAANDIRWIESRVILIKNHFGQVSHFYGYINDITKIKVSEEDLKLKVTQEVDKNREKDRILIQQSKLAAMGEMLGNIAHQWRQPLNNIALILQFLRDNYKNKDVNEEKIDKYLEKAYKHMEYMSDTIDDFKNFYKPSKTQNSFSLKESIDSLLYMIRNQFESENIAIEFKGEDYQITNYENELKQSLLNILNNAKDAIVARKKEENFNPLINIELKEENEKVKIYIRNNGGNIDKKIIDRIFEPYFTTKFENQGTGIGLYMTKSIIETNMKGKIEVYNLDNSVEFVITLNK
jgi:PAS domain S-box-containing protein